MENITETLPNPHYRTDLGSAYLGDSADLLKQIPTDSIDAIITSPPFALQRKKQYGNVAPDEYVRWFRKFRDQFHRILKPSGSLALHIGTSWNKGVPTKSLYHYELILDLCKKFHLAQEFFWHNPSRLPSPAEWVTVRRIRVKDAVEYVWWLSKSEFPTANNKRVLRPYSDAMKELLKNGYKAKLRPSGHDISNNFSIDHGGSIPPNYFDFANTESNSYYQNRCRDMGLPIHPARFPAGIPEFFIRLLTSPDTPAVVLDPFSGSNVTGFVAEQLGRNWIAFELDAEYVEGSRFRFEVGQHALLKETVSDYGTSE